MDGHSQIMASENDEMAYQSQMDMSSHNPSSEIQSQPQHADGQVEYCTQQMEHIQNSDNIQTMHASESQSVSDNNNDASNLQNEMSDQIQTNDKCGVDGNETMTMDIDKPQSELTNEENQEKNENENEKDTNEENDDKKEEDKNTPVENTDEAESHEQNGSLLVESEKEKEKAQKDEEIDLNQCRICMSSENLLDIFRIGDKTSFRICDLIMKIAPAVRISERDFLPHSICTICTERIETAYELRVQCEETDKFLRSKLKRSKRTRRAPAEFVIVDAPAESSSDSDDDEKSDDEFQISEDTEESSDSDSDSSYEEKKKRTTSRAVKRPAPSIQRKNQTKYQPSVQKQARSSSSSSVVYIKAGTIDDDSTPKKVLPVQKVPAKSIVNNRLMFRCNVCNRPCASAEALAQHRRTHADEKCNVCSMVFKQRSALLQHMERHKNDPERTCKKCSRIFPTKLECQRHIQIAHSESIACSKCKRSFPNKGQLNTHKCSNDHRTNPSETSSKRKSDVDVTSSGRDLFKSVAPLTTTYWSDSFSD